MIDRNLGIVAIATLVAGAGFLLKGEETSIYHRHEGLYPSTV